MIGIGLEKKNPYNLAKIFKMAANQTECFRLEQRSVMKVLLAKKCKPYEIYTRNVMCAEKHVNKKRRLYK